MIFHSLGIYRVYEMSKDTVFQIDFKTTVFFKAEVPVKDK